MASRNPKPERESLEVLPETGGEPEFHEPEPYKAELVHGGPNVRVYWGIRRGKYIKPEFTTVGTVKAIAESRVKLIGLVADTHNDLAMWQDFTGEPH